MSVPLALRCVSLGSLFGNNGSVWTLDEVYTINESCECESGAPRWVRILPRNGHMYRTMDRLPDGQYGDHPSGARFVLTIGSEP